MKLAVCSGKGGVGKSTVAFNLAAALDAVVVDADLGMADLPRGRGPDLHDVLAGRADPVEAVQMISGVRVLPCGRSLAGARACDPRRLAETVDAVSAEYGSVIIDSPAGMRADAGLPLFAADACVLVTTPDPASIADAVRVRAVARVFEAGLAAIAHNRVLAPDGATADTRTDTSRVERVLGGPAVVIAENRQVNIAQKAGVPVARIAPESRSAAQFSELAARVQSSRRI